MSDPTVTVFIRYKNNFDLSWLKGAIWTGVMQSINQMPISEYYIIRKQALNKELFYIKEIQLIKPKNKNHIE